MSGLQEAKNNLHTFLDKNISCISCTFWQKELFGGVCNGYEIKLGFMANDTGMCEQHEFQNIELQKQLEVLQDLYYNAWFIVEGFLYVSTPTMEVSE